MRISKKNMSMKCEYAPAKLTVKIFLPEYFFHFSVSIQTFPIAFKKKKVSRKICQKHKKAILIVYVRWEQSSASSFLYFVL